VHPDLRGYAEEQRLAEFVGRTEDVPVSVDESWHERFASAIDDLHPWGRRDPVPDCLDCPTADQDVRRRDDPLSVEQADVLDKVAFAEWMVMVVGECGSVTVDCLRVSHGRRTANPPTY